MRYYKAELPNAESYIKRGGSILRTTKNGVYNYASFQGNVSGLSFTNKPINSFTGEYYDIVEITRKEHTQLKKQEKELQDMPVTVVMAATQQGIKEISTTNYYAKSKLTIWYRKVIRKAF